MCFTKENQMKFLYFLIFLMLSGCGGNSSSGSSEQHYTLKNFNSLEQGLVFSSDLKSTDKKYEFYGKFSIENMKEEVLDGVMVTPQVVTFRKLNSLSGSSSFLGVYDWQITYYIETATGNLTSFKKNFFFSSSILNCKSTSPYHMPSAIKAGDSDTTPSFKCDNEKILDNGSWTAINETRKGIVLKIISKTTDELGNYKNNSISYTLDPNGSIISVMLEEEGLSSF
jgi:hypothetical protein